MKNNIDHRLTKQATTKTNGMVERANGAIKNNSILKIKYQIRQNKEKDMMGSFATKIFTEDMVI